MTPTAVPRPDAQELAAVVICRLSRSNASVSLVIAEAGGVAPLVSLIKKGSAAAQQQAAAALADDIEELRRTLGDVGSRTDPDAQGGGIAGGSGGAGDTSAGSGHNTENPEEDA